jgi:hypothetical protein
LAGREGHLLVVNIMNLSQGRGIGWKQLIFDHTQLKREEREKKRNLAHMYRRSGRFAVSRDHIKIPLKGPCHRPPGRACCQVGGHTDLPQNISYRKDSHPNCSYC